MTGETKPFPEGSKALNERLDVAFALKAAQLGVWEYDPVTKQVHWDDRCRALFGLTSDQPLTNGQATRYIHPDDVSRVTQAINWALNPQSGGAYDVTFRTIGADDGLLRQVRFFGQSYFTETGEVYRFAGIAQDMTALIQTQPLADSEERFRTMVEQAPVAMAVFRGDQLVFDIANDAYLPLIGKTKDEVVGKLLFDVLPETRSVLAPLAEEIMRTGVAFPASEFEIVLNRSGRAETCYFNFIWEPLREADGRVSGLMAVAHEVTAQVVARQKVEASEQYFRRLTDTVPAILWITEADGNCSYLSKQWYDYTGQTEAEAKGLGWLTATHPDDQADVERLFISANNTQSPFYAQYRLRGREGQYRWVIDKASPRFDAAGEYTGMIGTVIDIHDQKVAERALRENESLFRNVTNSSPTGLWLSDENGGLTYLNNTLVDWSGIPYSALLGPGWVNAIVEEDRQRSTDTFLMAVAARMHYEVLFRIRKADGSPMWCRAEGDPYYHDDGTFAGYAGFCMDIDELVKQRQALEASEGKLRAVVEATPAGIGVFFGRKLVIETANQALIDTIGKGPDIVGKPLREVLPELNGQPYFDILDDIFTSGQLFKALGSPVDVVQQGVLRHNFYDITYTPLYNAGGEVYAVLNTSVDVTEQVLARQKVEEAETTLRGAINMADLGTWQIDLVNGVFDYSQRLRGWFGFSSDEIITRERAYSPLRPEDVPRIREAIAQAIAPGSNGNYDVEYTVDATRAGRERILHVMGKAFFDSNGKAYKLIGTVHDVTTQRKRQLALEQEVQERTEALAATNEELATINEEMTATNEELAATNEELTEANQLLFRSNENLQQFAYVASHDLQEPLRKIQSFGDLLKNRYATELGEGVDHLERMQAAASRMSTLIRDLLAFSRISTQQDTVAPVSLKLVVDNVLTDLDLRIQETGAVVDVGVLPTVYGDALQLGQLFQNLISNALKFRVTNSTPMIQVHGERVAFGQLPPLVKPARQTVTYYRIDVTDNGIGFDDKYVDRIFQVFQRLHGKNEFAGTGIGLAICEKVATNHGGAITATSQPGQGATFSVYLPI